jgi:hypothetical protein
LTILLTVGSRTAAEPTNVYKPMGAPPNPKTPASWNRYHDYAQSTALLQALVKDHPNLCRLESLGKSQGGRDMWLLILGEVAKEKEAERPAFWIDGGIHANEVQATEIVLYTAWFLAEMHGKNQFVTQLLKERVFYMVPMMSPDSRDAHMYKPNTTHSPRSGQKPVDDDKDGLFDEDGPDDLDGDGSITQMRIPDPNGRWKAHPDHPDLLIPAKPDERGEFTMLGPEGVDNDGDGKVNEDADGYYDPNRDWAWNWQPAYVQTGAHWYPFSLTENRVVADFVMAHRNIAGAQSYHNSGGMILRGPGAKEDKYDAADVAVYDAVAQKGELFLPGYRYLNIATGLYEVYGGEIDWLFDMQGVFTFTNELFTPFNFFRKESKEGFFGRREEWHAFDKYMLFGEGIVPLKEIDHPQYGKVSVGGLRKEWLRQPPSFLLEEECHRNMAFSLYHADQMPRVKAAKVEVKALGGDLAEVSAVVENTRMIPTLAACDVKRKITPPDLVTISGPGLRVLLGLKASDSFFATAVDQKTHPEALRFDGIPGMSARYARWIVQGPGPYTVSVRSMKGGVDSTTRDRPKE